MQSTFSITTWYMIVFCIQHFCVRSYNHWQKLRPKEIFDQLKDTQISPCPTSSIFFQAWNETNKATLQPRLSKGERGRRGLTFTVFVNDWIEIGIFEKSKFRKFIIRKDFCKTQKVFFEEVIFKRRLYRHVY